MGIELALAGLSAAGGIYSAKKQSDAAKDAAATQAGAAQDGMAAQERMLDKVQQLLAPYVNAGTTALGAQGNLAGLAGADAQQQAISAIEASPAFTALTRQGERGILANASATGGLRGGNTQAALAEFRPAMLAQLIDQQYGRLGGLSALGQNAAAMTGNAFTNTGNNIATLMQQQGAALAGGQLAAGKAQAGYANAITNGLGMFYGLGGKF